MKKIALIAIIILMAIHSYGFIVLNETGCTYEGECPPEGESAMVQSLKLEPIIISAAGYLLESSSHYHFFLNEIESTQLLEAKSDLYSTISKMTDANRKYVELVATAATIPYNESYINKLNNFNYDEFQARHALNATIFQDLKEYLKEGKITELYTRFRTDTSTLILLLFKVKADLDTGNLKLLDLITVEQKITNLILMGQYASLVYNEL